MRRQRDLKFTEWMRSTNLNNRQIDEITESNMGSHYLTDKEQPAVATVGMFDKLRPFLPEVPEWVEQMVAERTIESENFKKREVVGTKLRKKSIDGANGFMVPGAIIESVVLDITAPATPEAQQWDGWGTALKPAHEPIVLARKPLSESTVANNVLTYGTGALNIDGCRVVSDDWDEKTVLGKYVGNNSNNDSVTNNFVIKEIKSTNTKSTLIGRFPANFIHDGSDEVVALFPDTPPAKASMRGKITGVNTNFSGPDGFRSINDLGGSAARFFYCAKASKSDRNEGLEGFPLKLKPYGNREENQIPEGGDPKGSINDKFTIQPSTNFHPTVKPIDLMRYLVRLITPPNGTVLDPFMGSGSTGKAAILEGFDFIGIEQDKEYVKIARARIKFARYKVKKKSGQTKNRPIE